MRKIITLASALALALTANAQAKTVTLTDAGTLAAAVGNAEKYSTTELKVVGPVNGADIAFIRDMAGRDEEGEATEGKLRKLDLTDANIVDGGVYYTDMQSGDEYTATANTIGKYMFRQLQLKDITLPASITTVGDNAFANEDSLTAVSGFENATVLGSDIFKNCSALSNVAVNTTLTAIPAGLFNGCESLSAFTFPTSVTKIGASAFKGTALAELNLPESVDSIGDEAFESIPVTTLTFPASLRYIGRLAFFYCGNVTNINFNDGLKTIDENAFSYAEALQTVEVPNSVDSIGGSAFANSGLVTAKLPDGLKYLAEGLFDRCDNLTTLNIPSTVETIADLAFQNDASLTNLVLPDSLRTIGERAFSGCEGITEVVLPSKVVTVGGNAFDYCSSVTKLVLDANLRNIGASAFSGLAIKDLVVPEGVTDLSGPAEGVMSRGGMVFAMCDSLETIHLPSTIEKIGQGTFFSYGDDETGLSKVRLISIDAKTPPTITDRDMPFYGVDNENCRLIVPKGTADAYREADGWSDFVNISALDYDLAVTTTEPGTLAQAIPDSVRHTTESLKVSGPLNGDDVIVLRDMAGVDSNDHATEGITKVFDFADASFVSGGSAYASYYDRDNWEDVNQTTQDNVFPVHFFSAGARQGCEITKVVLPTSIYKIGATAFQNTASLDSIDIPEGVKSIGSNAFSGSGLKAVVIPESVDTLGTYAFYGCANMTKAELLNHPKSLPEGLFSQTSITSFNIPESVEDIGTAVFHFCYSLAEVTGGANVKNIDSYAFNYCSALKSLTLSDSLESIGGGALSNCSALETLTIPAKVSYIANGGFYGTQFAGCYGLKEINVDEANEAYSSIDGMLLNKAQTELIQCPAGYSSPDSIASVPEGVTKIDDTSFDYCLGISYLELPSTLTEVGNSAFMRCVNVKRIDCDAVTPPSCGWSSPFDFIDQANCLLVVPDGSVESYKEADYWKDFNITTPTTLGINGLSAKDGNSSVVSRYNLGGAKVGSSNKGLQIIRMSDGTVKKIIVK